MITIDDVLNAMKTAPLPERACSICGYEMSWFLDGEQLMFDPGCNCSSRGPKPPETRTRDDLAFYLVPEHGHIERFTKFVEEQKGKK